MRSLLVFIWSESLRFSDIVNSYSVTLGLGLELRLWLLISLNGELIL